MLLPPNLGFWQSVLTSSEKNSRQSLLYFCSTFKISSLACSLSLSISFCTLLICSIASCCSFFSFSKFEEADASSGLKARVSLTVFSFLAWSGSENWCLGAMLGKKAKNPPRGRERYCKLRELLICFLCGTVLRCTLCYIPKVPSVIEFPLPILVTWSLRYSVSPSFPSV